MPIESIEIEAEIEVNKNITIGHKLKYPHPFTQRHCRPVDTFRHEEATAF